MAWHGTTHSLYIIMPSLLLQKTPTTTTAQKARLQQTENNRPGRVFEEEMSKIYHTERRCRNGHGLMLYMYVILPEGA